jgi:predicted AAA+ superfamily ATPase
MNDRPQYIEKIQSWMGQPVIKVLSGMRRSGKSCLLELLGQELLSQGRRADQLLILNMESLELAEIATAESLYRYVKSRFPQADLRQTLMVDEVQEVEGWERCINSLLAEAWCDLVVTGSNANLFSAGLATLLAGRHVVIPVYPLSFREFCDFRATGPGEEALLLYLRWGGLPGLYRLGFDRMTKESPDLGRDYLGAILDTVVLKDIVERHKVRDPAFLTLLLRFAAGNLGNLFSAKSIADWLKSEHRSLSVETVQNYVQYLAEAQLLYPVQRYDIRAKAVLAYQEKLFLADLGLRHVLIPWRIDDIGGMLENVVYLELIRRGWRVSVGKSGDREVDFVAERNGELQYIQVAYLLPSPETSKREFSVLEDIRDHHPKLVLSLDRFNSGGRNGIKQYYLPDWLYSSPDFPAGSTAMDT